MEELLRQIVADLQLIKQDTADLKDGQLRLEGRMDRLEGRMDRLEGRMDSLESEVTGLKSELAGVKSELREVKELAQSTFTQVGILTEFRTEMSEFRSETSLRLDQLTDELQEHGRVIERLSFRSIAQEAEIVSLQRAK